MLEDRETFNLIIAEDSLPENVTLGIPYLTRVTIFNSGGSSKYAIDNYVCIYDYIPMLGKPASGHSTYVCTYISQEYNNINFCFTKSWAETSLSDYD